MLGSRPTGRFTLVVAFSLMASWACAGATGCSSSSASGVTDDGGGDGDLADVMTDAPPADDSGPTGNDAGDGAPTTEGGDGGTADGCGGPVASFPTGMAMVDLGGGNCGGPSVTQTYTITNSGCAPLTVGAVASGTGFSVSPTTLSISPGAAQDLTISASVPQTTVAGTALTGSITLTTSDPANAMTTIPLSVTPTGATLAWGSGSPSAASFGQQPLNLAASPIALTLVNSGNAAATVTFGAPSDAQFSLAPTAATMIAPGSSAGLTAGFTPSSTTVAMSNSAFSVSGAVCGTSVSSLAFSGQGALGVVTGYPTQSVQAAAVCGSAPAAQTFTLTNSGPVPVILAATLSDKTWSTNANGAVIPASGKFQVSVQAPAIPFPSTPGVLATPTLTITTNVAGDTPHVVGLEQDAKGAVLAWDTSPTPNFGAFGPEPGGSTASQSFNVVNSGNMDSSVTLTPKASPPFGATNLKFTATAGNSVGDTATFAPQTFGGATGSLAMSGTNLCQPLPSSINLTGTGESGGISLSTQSLTFSSPCGGSAAAAQSFTITNSGNQPMTWCAAIQTGTWYAVSSGGGAVPAFCKGTSLGGTLNAGDIASVTVTPSAIASGGDPNTATYADTVTVTTNIVNDTPHSVSLSDTPLGDVLSIDKTSLAFGKWPIGTTSAAMTFNITNAANPGSPPASISLKATDPTDFPMSATTVSVPAGGSTGTNVAFHAPSTPASYGSTMTLSTSDFLCKSTTLPGPVVASGTATQAGPIISPQTLYFGSGSNNPLVNCGAVGATRTVTVQNSGNQDFQITSLKFATGTYYTVKPSAPLPATVSASLANTVTLTITPNAIPQSVATVPSLTTFSDTLTVATNANVPTPNTNVTLNMGAQGAILGNNLATTNWNFGTVTVGSQGTFNVLLNNTGNAPVQASLTGMTEPTIFNMLNNPLVQSGALNGSLTLQSPTLTITSYFSPQNSGGWADTGTLTIVPTTGNVLCQPLPTSWKTPTIVLQGIGQ